MLDSADHYSRADEFEFGVNNYINTASSSTGEIIYKLLKCGKFVLDKPTARALFTAISTDTGGLRYSNTTPESMRICAELLETGENSSLEKVNNW